MDHKRMRMSSADDDQNIVQDDVAGPSNQPPVEEEQRPDIFKLDTDCCDVIFEYLRLKDLHSLAQTCKTMQRVTGDYYKRSKLDSHHYIGENGTDYPAFSRWMTGFEICLGGIEYIQNNHKELESLEYLKVSGVDEPELVQMKETLSQIHTLDLHNCDAPPGFYLNIPKYFTNLKRLIIMQANQYNYECDIGPDESWQKYDFPNLEDLTVIDGEYIHSTMEGVGAFLQRHPSIRRFSTHTMSLGKHSTELLNSNVALETFKIGANLHEDEVSHFIELIHQLYAQGFYKRLKLSVCGLRQKLFGGLSTFKGMYKLSIISCCRKIRWSPLPSITELTISSFVHSASLNDIVDACVNVESVEIVYPKTVDDILLLFRQSRKLCKIKINGCRWTFIDLHMLNREREKLPGAKKVVMYVQENLFVKVKWATHNGIMDLKFVELKIDNMLF